MRKVRNYLNEVLEMKSNEVWLSFEGKCEFLCVGVAEWKKIKILKAGISSPLKTVFFAFCELVTSLVAKYAIAKGKISQFKSESRGTQEILYLKFLKIEIS